MAEFIFKDMIAKKGLESEFYVSSSATSSEEIIGGVGNEVYPPAKRELLKHGISCEGKRAVRLTFSDYEKYDLFVVMDSANYRNSVAILGGDKDKKVHYLLDFANRKADVADPWYTGDFATTYKDIYEGCEGLLKTIKK